MGSLTIIGDTSLLARLEGEATYSTVFLKGGGGGLGFGREGRMDCLCDKEK